MKRRRSSEESSPKRDENDERKRNASGPAAQNKNSENKSENLDDMDTAEPLRKKRRVMWIGNKPNFCVKISLLEGNHLSVS